MANNVNEIRSVLGLKSDCNLAEVTITPLIAQELLKFNTNNRPRQIKREKDYETDMREGKFYLQESVIGFDSNGVLTNGQSRLHACIKADTSFNTIIKINLEQNIHMDSGKTRNMIDNIKLNGVLDSVIDVNANSLKAASSLIRLVNHNARVRAEKLVEFCKENAEVIDKCHELGLLNLNGNKKYLFKVEIASAFLAAALNGVQFEKLSHIREILTHGRSTDEQDIVIQNYRDRVLQMCGNGGGASGSIKKQIFYGAQYIIYCYDNNKKNKLVKMDAEYYPVLT